MDSPGLLDFEQMKFPELQTYFTKINTLLKTSFQVPTNPFCY